MIQLLKRIEFQIYTTSLIACILWFIADSGLYVKIKFLSFDQWFPRSGWEPFIVFLAVITTVTGIASVQGRRTWNTDLGKKFLQEFPSKGFSVPFLKDHDMGAPFHNNSLKEMENFLENWSDAEHEFMDKKAENKKKELYNKLKAFHEKLSLNIFPMEREGMFSMEIANFETNEHKLKTMRELNESSFELYEIHQELTKRILKLMTI